MSQLVDTTTLGVFVGAALILLITPGPAVLYIVARSVDQGRLAGLISGAGLSCGGLVHVAAASFGLSAILVSSATLFAVVKLAGAAYLVWLGVRTLLTAKKLDGQVAEPRRSLRRIFRDGVVVNLLNPKAAAFFFAFLPQFVDPQRGSAPAQFLILGLIFVALGMLTDACYAFVAGTVGGWLRRNPGVLRAQRVVAGLVYLGLGAAAAAR